MDLDIDRKEDNQKRCLCNCTSFNSCDHVRVCVNCV